MGDVLPLTRSRGAAAPQSRPEPVPRTDRRPDAEAEPEPLWRDAVGRELRAERTSRGERIADVAGRAGVSPQYLSEVERGRKDPSSEMLSAVAGALDLTVRELTRRACVRMAAGPGEVRLAA